MVYDADVSKLLGGVSLVEQDTIENVSVAYFKLASKFKDFFCFSHLYFMQLFRVNTTIFLEFCNVSFWL